MSLSVHAFSGKVLNVLSIRGGAKSTNQYKTPPWQRIRRHFYHGMMLILVILDLDYCHVHLYSVLSKYCE